jgi:hypothetical protein
VVGYWLGPVNERTWQVVLHRRVWRVNDALAEVLDNVRRGDAIVFCKDELTQILGIYGVVDEPFADKEPMKGDTPAITSLSVISFVSAESATPLTPHLARR